jgi:hypothetical protein
MRAPFVLMDRNPTNDGMGEQGRGAASGTDGASVVMIFINVSVYSFEAASSPLGTDAFHGCAGSRRCTSVARYRYRSVP